MNKSEVKLVASFENLLEKTPLDITPSINAVGFSSDKTSPEILIPDDTRSDLGPAESR